MIPVWLLDTIAVITSTEPGPPADVLGRPTRIPAAERTARCRLGRADPAEFATERDGHTVTDLYCYLPAGDPVTDSDLITVDGAAYTVIGAPVVFRSPWQNQYVRVRVRAVRDAT